MSRRIIAEARIVVIQLRLNSFKRKTESGSADVV